MASGAIQDGDPTLIPVRVTLVPFIARAIPKSMMRGPVGPIRTFEGFRSRSR